MREMCFFAEVSAICISWGFALKVGDEVSAMNINADNGFDGEINSQLDHWFSKKPITGQVL